MKKLNLYLVAGALTGLILPDLAFAQAGAGTGPGTGGGAGAGAGAGVAAAHNLGAFKPVVLEIQRPSLQDLARVRNGRLRKTRRDYTNEQAVVKTFQGAKTGLYVEMRTGALSTGATPQNKVQVACTPFALTQDPATGAVNLTKGIGEKFVTNNNGDERRNGNKPELVPINGGNHMLLMFNYRPNGANNTRRYAKVLDAQCNELTVQNAAGQTRTQVLVMQKNNDDCDMHQTGQGPCDIATDAAGVTHMSCWAGCNGNGEDKGWLNDLTVKCVAGAGAACTAFQITKNFDIALAQREERSRGRVSFGTDPTVAIATWTEGNNQPQRDGTWIAAVDVTPGLQNGADAQSRLLWKQQFDGRKQLAAAIGNGNNGNQGINNGQVRTYSVRMAQSRLFTAGPNGVLTPTDNLFVQAGDANGRNNDNHKGGTYRQLQAAVVKATRTGLEYVVPKTDVTNVMQGIDGTHLTMCPAVFGGGTDLIPGATFLQGSHNGGGVLSPQFMGLGIDLANKQFVNLGTRNAGGSYDRALYSNYLGGNPGNQGRNFTGCDVIANPFAGQLGNTTSHFIIHAMTGKNPLDVSNAALKPSSWVTLAPIATTVARGTHALLEEEGSNDSSGCTAVQGKAGVEGLLLVGAVLGLVRISRRRRA